MRIVIVDAWVGSGLYRLRRGRRWVSVNDGVEVVK